MQHFLGRLSAFIGRKRLASAAVESRHSGMQAEGDKQIVAVGHQSACQLSRAALERPHVIVPGGNLTLPEQGAVKGIASHQLPVGGQFNRDPRAFIMDQIKPA